MSLHHLPTPAAETRVMRVWSRDRQRSQVIANTKATFDAIYGVLSHQSGPHIVCDDNTLNETDALSWIAAERAVAKHQAEMHKAESRALTAAAVEAQRQATVAKAAMTVNFQSAA